jgi:cold shock CspA family protein
VITVHHPDYYQTDSNPPPPADWDNTTPIPFLSATGNYLISLAGPNEWVEKAFDILELALRKQGIGAKTSSGYGRMSFGNFSFAKAQRVETYAVAKNRLLSESPPSGRYRGTVTNVRGSFAFINQAKGGAQMFVHSSQIRGNLPLREGQVVEYRIGQHNGEDQAQDVEILLEPDD